jgi:flagellar biosynthesis protein FliR
MNAIIVALSEIAVIGQDVLAQTFIVFLRVGAMMALIPAFGEQMVPQRVRIVLALAFTSIVAPAVGAGLPILDDAMPKLLITETLCGLALGIALRLFVHALQIAGAIAAQATSLAQIFGGTGPEPQPAIGHLLTIAGLALAVTSGLHIRVAQYLIYSYEILPAGLMPNPSDMADWGVVQITRAFGLAFSLAAPFVIAAFLYNLALGIINRAMPQLMVAFVGAPALTAGGLVVLALVMPYMLAAWVTALNGFLDLPFGPH